MPRPGVMGAGVLAATSTGALGVLGAVALCTLLECSVGLGVVLPAETVVVGAAVAAANDVVPLWSVFLVAWACGVAGDSVGFLIGRRWGRRLLDRYGPRLGLTAERARRADDVVARWGTLGVAGGRFVPAVRILVMPTAGMSEMPWRRFVVADAAGVAGWAAAHCGNWLRGRPGAGSRRGALAGRRVGRRGGGGRRVVGRAASPSGGEHRTAGGLRWLAAPTPTGGLTLPG